MIHMQTISYENTAHELETVFRCGYIGVHLESTYQYLVRKVINEIKETHCGSYNLQKNRPIPYSALI